MSATNETNCLHNLLLTAKYISSLCKTSTNNWSVTMNLSKTQLSKIKNHVDFLDH